jgi:hypothetical protein
MSREGAGQTVMPASRASIVKNLQPRKQTGDMIHLAESLSDHLKV